MIRVLIVDDSAVVRKVLSEELSKCSGIEVVGTAVDPYAAREKIAELHPDVITLDVEMPRMDGLSFLEKLMQHHPIPTVIVSSVTPQQSEAAIRALEIGAVEVISKPGSAFSIPDVASQLTRAIRRAASARVDRLRATQSNKRPQATADFSQIDATHRLIAIGASTGGTRAIEEVIRSLPTQSPGVLICQHMPAHFTAAFASRLNSVCALEVREARHGDTVAPGRALVAPGDQHMLLARSGAHYEVHLKDGPLVHYQRPSVDVLFHSVAQHAGRNAVGAILTGMGADGAKGLLAMRERGAQTFAEDESTCIVYGMPAEAMKIGAAMESVPLHHMAQRILRAAGHAPAKAPRTPRSSPSF